EPPGNIATVIDEDSIGFEREVRPQVDGRIVGWEAQALDPESISLAQASAQHDLARLGQIPSGSNALFGGHHRCGQEQRHQGSPEYLPPRGKANSTRVLYQVHGR